MTLIILEMWSISKYCKYRKFGNSSISMRDVIISSIL